MSDHEQPFSVAPGDVLLFEPGHDDPISALICRLTASRYSHSAIVLGSDSYAHATVVDDGGPDIVEFDTAFLEHKAEGRVVDLLRHHSATFDPVAMRAHVSGLQVRAAAQGDERLIFSDGALAGLALLRLVASDRWLPLSDHSRERLQRALVVALDDTDRRLFCSEFVYRVASAGGHVPELPAQPFIPSDVVPPVLANDAIDIAEQDGFLDRMRESVITWMTSIMKRRGTIVGFDLDSVTTFAEVWEAVVDAYDNDRYPSHVERANFFVPGDFAESTQYRHVATWSSTGWQPLPAR